VAVADTVEWLDRHSIPYRDLCFLGDKPQVEADAYIDDAPHNIEALRSSGAEAVIFSQRYNSEVEGPRAAGWSEVEDWVLSLMAARGYTVQPTIPLRLDRPHGPTGEIR
jgi:5'(3')-deoxyribonucleotidase